MRRPAEHSLAKYRDRAGSAYVGGPPFVERRICGDELLPFEIAYPGAREFLKRLARSARGE